MPPAAIAVERRGAVSSVLAAAEQELERRAGGNFGAPPQPPHCGSKPRAQFRCASASSAVRRAAPATAARRAPERMCSASSSAERSTSSRRSRQASETARSTCWNDGSPCRGSGGKYVPPKNGSPAGVRNIVIGQPPLPGQRDDRVHVDRVEVGPLLAIDLDADEALVHQRGGRLVLERLVLHHVAPVAGGVADREQDRHVLARARARAPPRPTGTSRPDCPRAGAGTGTSRPRGGSQGKA